MNICKMRQPVLAVVVSGKWAEQDLGLHYPVENYRTARKEPYSLSQRQITSVLFLLSDTSLLCHRVGAVFW